jgi:hypothetical protein
LTSVLRQAETDAISIDYYAKAIVRQYDQSKVAKSARDSRARGAILCVVMMRLAGGAAKVHLSFKPCCHRARTQIEALP